MNRKLLTLLLITGLFSSCIKQAIEETQKQKVIDAVTKGAWYVNSFKENATDLTSSFGGFLFYFKEDGTVQAVKDTISMNGTWIGDISTKSITSEFTSVTDPIRLLNGTWKIDDSYYDKILASKITETGKNILDLRQQ